MPRHKVLWVMQGFKSPLYLGLRVQGVASLRGFKAEGLEFRVECFVFGRFAAVALQILIM